MTLRQRLLKWAYPLFVWFKKKSGTTQTASAENIQPPVSFYSLQATQINGQPLSFRFLQGKKVLLVNTASDCGFTRQYEELQQLYERFAGKLEIIGFPANDFKQQEKGSNEEIATFCKTNYGIGFPLTQKTSVVSGSAQHPVYAWLTQKAQNGWNEQPPTWNFAKYLVNENGQLTHYFDPAVSPLGEEFLHTIK